MQSNTVAVPVPHPNTDWRQQMKPESWRVLLLGRIDDLDRLHCAFGAVETLVENFDAGDENSLDGLACEDLHHLLSTLNEKMGQLLLEAREAYVGSAL